MKRSIIGGISRSGERQKLNGTRDGLKSELDAAQASAKATQDVELSQEACDKASTIARNAQARHIEAVAVAETHERAFLSAQASVLAQRLQNGHPCPVCGASDHPEPAHGSRFPAAKLSSRPCPWHSGCPTSSR